MKQTYCFFSTFAHRVLTVASARAKLLTAIALCLFSVGNVWGGEDIITFTDKEWKPWQNVKSGSSFESTSLARGVANNGVNGICKSSSSYTNITEISLVCSSNTTGGKVNVFVGDKDLGDKSISNSNITTYIYENLENLSGVITIKVTKPSSKTLWVKSITITTASSSAVKHTLTYYEGNTSTDIEVAEGANILEALKDITPTPCDATSRTFIGWTTKPINGKQPACPELIADDATIASNMTVYAVFAKSEGTSGLTQMKTGETLAEGDNIVIFATTIEDNLRYALYQKSTTSGYIDYWGTKSSNGPTAAEIDDELKYVTVTAGRDGKWILGDAANGYLYNSSSTTMNVTVSNKSEWTIIDNGDDTFCFDAVQRLSCRNDLTSSNQNKYRGGGEKRDSGVMTMKVYKYVKPTFSDYLTMCDPCEELNITWNDMQATNVVRQTATLSWGMSSTEHVTGYSVDVWSTSSTVETFTVEGAATTTLNLTDLSRETTYNWTVTALTEHGWCTTTSDAKQFVTIGAEQLPAPGNPKVVYNPETDKYTFSWDKVENATEYKMTNAFSSSSNIKGTSSTRDLHSNLIPGKEYTATVQAIGDGTNYTNSETASVTFTAHTYTLTLSVTDNGTITTKTFTKPTVTLPTETSTCEALEGWTFAGWSETDIAEESTTTAPALIAAGIEYGPDGGYIKRDRTLYAVFSKTEEGENAGLYYLSESNYYIGAFDSKYFKAVSTMQDAVAFGIEDGKYLYAYVNGIKTYYSHTKSGDTDITSATTNPKEWTITETGTTIQLCSTAQSTRYLGYSTVFRAYAAPHTLKKLPATTTLYTTSPQCTDCDAPHNLWASATADAVTIVWEAASPTATVKIYSDEAGTIVFKEQESGATDNHQCRITGLEQNKKYWYRVFSAGTCGSAIASFTTESKDISIVEWEKQAVIVDINTEVANGVSVVVEKRVEHGSGNQNIAEDLFFSKYYEASGNVKLLGIYNGTKNNISLANCSIRIGIDTWENTLTGNIPLNGLVEGNVIAPQQEIIFWTYTDSDNDMITCINGNINNIKDFVLLKIGEPHFDFSGRQSIALVQNGKMIDLIGAINSAGTTIEGTSPVEGECKPAWGDMEDKDRTYRNARCGWGYSIEDKTTQIELSTNRCLLVRSSSVKSGKNAVDKNVGKFTTLGDGESGVTADCEWLGRQVSKYKEDGTDDKGRESSCAGFSYVAGFDYNDYYTTYEKMDNAVFNGTPNENGTYTIQVPDLPQLACTDIRLQLTKKNGEVTASVEQKVPIIVTEDANTTDELFSANGLTPEICKTCDVVVRDKSRLTHAAGQTEFRNMFIYHDSELKIDDDASLTLDKLRMFALNDSVSYAIINNTNDADHPTITVNEVSHVKRIDGRYWYPFSLPYNCHISQISALNGKGLGKYGTDWCIKYYNGEQRQKDGTSAAIGQVSQYWEKLGESEKLEAYKGYIIGLYCPTAEEAHQKSVHFAPARQSVYTETGESKTTDVHNWPDNLEAEARHHGWNFTGSPYISLFGVNASGDGLFNDQLKMGYTDKLTGEQLDKEHVYLSIPDGKDTRTYTQVLARATTVKPFTAYFVQTIDPNDGMGHKLPLTYQKARRTFPGEEPNPTLAPRRAAERDAVLFAEINLTDNAAGGQDTYLRDNTGVLVSDRFSADYEIGDDLTKMYAAAGKPQLYTMAGNEKMAYNALPDGLAHNLPLGIYVPKAGEYTLSLNRHASRLENAEAVYLLHSGIIVADLLLSDYTILATAKGEQAGYMLDIRRATKVVTGTEQIATDEPYAIMRDGQLTIGNLPTASDVAIYDALGRLVWSEQQATTPVVADLPQTGVYMVLITSGEQQYVLKSLNR